MKPSIMEAVLIHVLRKTGPVVFQEEELFHLEADGWKEWEVAVSVDTFDRRTTVSLRRRHPFVIEGRKTS